MIAPRRTGTWVSGVTGLDTLCVWECIISMFERHGAEAGTLQIGAVERWASMQESAYHGGSVGSTRLQGHFGYGIVAPPLLEYRTLFAGDPAGRRELRSFGIDHQHRLEILLRHWFA